jgi:pimeloyl-ACP methyl ester carboxylesterase
MTDLTIRPFQVHVPDKDLADLQRRVAATRWPGKELVADQSQGVQLAAIQALVTYWGTGYDWRRCEAKLNALPQFVTEIDDLGIHLIHVTSRYPDAMPLIITRGWPGSVIEMLEVIGPLTDPTAHGGSAGDAFDLVIPSLPGYGFSSAPTAVGWDPGRTARAWAELMHRLGYARYYAAEQGQSPQTIGYPLTDSPAGLAAWMLDHDTDSYQKISRAFAGRPPSGGLTRDHILDNITLYWLTSTATSAARMYWEGGRSTAAAAGQPPPQVSLPVAFTVFPDEIFQAPGTWVEQVYPNLIYFHQVGQGGHFAAWEQPQLFTDELRTGFRSLR